MKIFLANTYSSWRGDILENYMKIYLAGTLTGNNSYIYRDMNVHLVDLKRIKKDMEIFIARGNCGWMTGKEIKFNDFLDIYILESFFYLDDWMKVLIKKKVFKRFLLDSGAFTFMTGVGGEVNWEEYVDKYAKFIKEYDVELFFELDIDSVVGLKKVEELRGRLEEKSGKRCIPVWHKSRGKEYFIKMCEEYNYVAIGGIVTKEITGREHKHFPWLIDIAHQNNAKIHGLGYTNLKGLKKYHFDSVDSTAWIYGNRGGYLYKFTGNTLKQIQSPEGLRLKGREAAIHNFQEWIKFQKYADKNL